jgi:hypothetical protein
MPNNQILSDISRLKLEVNHVFDNIVIPNWGSENLHGFPDTLYGFMMRVMSHIDLLSYYWDLTQKGYQTVRMIDFMDTYFDRRSEQNSILVHMWRHQLMHTAEPRIITDTSTGVKYRWLLHWGPPYLPLEHHYEINTNIPNEKILQLGLIYLVDQLEIAATSYIKDLDSSIDLQNNFKIVEKELQNVEKKII